MKPAMRNLLVLLLISASACAVQGTSTGAAGDVPQPPPPGPMQAEAEQAKAAIETAARDCAAGRLVDVRARVEHLKVSRPARPDINEAELAAALSRLCAGAGPGSLAEINTIVEEVSIQQSAALATVTLYGRLRGVPSDEHFVVRGLVHLLRGPGGWVVSRAAYWPHSIPPVS